MLESRSKENLPTNNSEKSSLPNDEISQDSSDLDDEIPLNKCKKSKIK